MQIRFAISARLAAATLGCLLLAACSDSPDAWTLLDEAQSAGRDVASLPAADEDYFHDMDGGIALSADEIKGRNTWIVWTGGNDRFWDGMTAIPSSACSLTCWTEPSRSIARQRFRRRSGQAEIVDASTAF